MPVDNNSAVAKPGSRLRELGLVLPIHEIALVILFRNLRDYEVRVPKGAEVKRIHPTHSSRMSLDGSTASARRAGMADATMPSNAIDSAAPATTTGSRGFA
jgi:hypothetical protein